MTLLATTATKKVSKEKRSVHFSWENPEMTRRVKISVYHHSDRKYFSASVCRSDIETRGNFSIEKYEPFSDIMQLGKEPIARFSLVKLEEYADKVLADFIATESEWNHEAFYLVLPN